MATFSDSWQITKTSFGVLRKNPSLLALPALAGLAAVGILALFAVPLLVAFLLNPAGFLSFSGATMGRAVLVALFVVLYFLLVFVGNFFVAALVGAAMMQFNGARPTVRQGLQFARQRVGRILVWSLVAATVGLIIQAIASRFRGLPALILRFAAGVTWGAVTYFIVPVIVFESGGVWASLKRSGSLFVQTFGRTLVSNLFVGLIIVGLIVLGFVPLGLGLYILFAGGPVAAAVGLVLLGAAIWIFGMVLAAALGAILRTALYRYATTGQVTPGILPQQYQGAMAGQPLVAAPH